MRAAPLFLSALPGFFSGTLKIAMLAIALMLLSVEAPLAAQTQADLFESLREPVPGADDPHALTVLDYYRRATTPPTGSDPRPRLAQITGTRKLGRETRQIVITASSDGRLHEQETEVLTFGIKNQSRGFDGTTAWQFNPEWQRPQYRPMTPGLTEAFIDGSRLIFPLDWAGGFVRYTYRGIVPRSDPASVVVRGHRADGRYVDLTFTSRGYLLQVARWKEIYSGSVVERSWHFSEWQNIGGRWSPVVIDIRLTDRPFGQITIDTFQWEPPVPPTLFTMPTTQRSITLSNDLARQQANAPASEPVR